MEPTTIDLIEAIDHLPAGGKLLLSGVSWDEYEELIEEIGERRHLRVSYDNGSLEILTVSLEHASCASLFPPLIAVLTETLDLEFFCIGSATLKLKPTLKGKEPDDSFYIGDLSRILGKRRLDLAFDSPPDLVIEVDLGIPTFDKLAIYAGLSVPEVWRFDGQQTKFYRLAEARYEKVAKSELFPFLPPSVVTEHLRLRDTQGVNAICRAFRNWVRDHKP
jgi:Uma2 family endonuclease